MITKNEVNEKAVQLGKQAAYGEPMPPNLTQPEQVYYLTLRKIYNDYRSGVISREQGASEKKQAVNAFIEAIYIYERAKYHAEIHDFFTHEFHKDNEVCKRCRLYDIICGIMQSEESEVRV